MKAHSQGGYVSVRVSGEDVTAFNHVFPCSGIPNGSSFEFELDARNGDLVNITMWLNPEGVYRDYAGEAVDSGAFSHDATNFAVGAGMLPQWAKR